MDGCTADVQLPQSVLISPARAQLGCSPLLSGFPVSSPPPVPGGNPCPPQALSRALQD